MMKIIVSCSIVPFPLSNSFIVDTCRATWREETGQPKVDDKLVQVCCESLAMLWKIPHPSVCTHQSVPGNTTREEQTKQNKKARWMTHPVRARDDWVSADIWGVNNNKRRSVRARRLVCNFSGHCVSGYFSSAYSLCLSPLFGIAHFLCAFVTRHVCACVCVCGWVC